MVSGPTELVVLRLYQYHRSGSLRWFSREALVATIYTYLALASANFVNIFSGLA